MRQLSAGNKMNFTIFIFITIAILFIILLAVINGLRNQTEKYQVSPSACVYDKDYNYIELNNESQIEKKWTGKYYLRENNTQKEYELGNYAVVYDKSKNALETFGTFFKVLKNGDINKITEHNKLNNVSENSFYKIEDRKYLISAKNIKNATSNLSTENYLIIILDKLGNALLLNDKMNVKTINEMTISTNDFSFDVANETLTYNNDDVIDLKKIIGSSNEYVPIVQEIDLRNELNTLNTAIASNANRVDEQLSNILAAQVINNNSTTSNTNTTNNTNNTNESTSVIQNEGTTIVLDTGAIRDTVTNTINNSQIKENDNKEQNNNTIQNTEPISEPVKEPDPEQNKANEQKQDTSWVDPLNRWISDVANAFDNIFKGKTNNNNTKLNRSVALNGLSTGTTYIDIDYTIVDPENKYNVVYATISNGTNSADISLSKELNRYRVTGLNPNTNYTVEIGYKIMYSSSEAEDVKQDAMTVKTKKPIESLKITKITTKNIYYTLKLDNTYVYDPGCKIAIYLNDEENEYESLELSKDNIEEAAMSGYTGSFEIPQNYKIKNNSLKIKLKDTKYGGMNVNTNLVAKIVNY